MTSLVDWACEWQISSSVDKCCVLYIGQQSTPPHITINNCVLPIVPQTRDLGIVVCADLSPAAHICDIATTAQKRANLFYAHLYRVMLILLCVHIWYMSDRC